jgi:hypothetical protein
VKLSAEDHAAVCAKTNRNACVRNAISEKLQREPVRLACSLSGRKVLFLPNV